MNPNLKVEDFVNQNKTFEPPKYTISSTKHEHEKDNYKKIMMGYHTEAQKYEAMIKNL